MNKQLSKVLAHKRSKQAPVRNGILIILSILVILLMVNAHNVNTREARYIEEMRAFKEQAELATQYADSLDEYSKEQQAVALQAEKRASVAEQQARRSKRATDTLLRELEELRKSITDSTEMARVIIPKQDSIITEQQVTIDRQDVQITFLNVALVAKDSALILSNLRGDSLQTVVDNIPEPPTVPTINRKKAFFGGVIVGIALKVFVF